ncbi:MAG: hypothetical protein LUG49_08695 [Oscillospiraceae bacterium]|nr:hypothetical protein [Oscillospiraceae bacterium]
MEYEKAEMEIVIFEFNDVVVLSNGGSYNLDDDSGTGRGTFGELFK